MSRLSEQVAGRLAFIRAHGNLSDPSVALRVLDLEPGNEDTSLRLAPQTVERWRQFLTAATNGVQGVIVPVFLEDGEDELSEDRLETVPYSDFGQGFRTWSQAHQDAVYAAELRLRRRGATGLYGYADIALATAGVDVHVTVAGRVYEETDRWWLE